MKKEKSKTKVVDPRLPDEPFRNWCERRGFSVAKGYAMIKEGTARRERFSYQGASPLRNRELART